jgi:molybdenum cofactor biosynthesis protein B
MAGIDETRSFVALKIAVLTVSDTRELADDKSGATLAARIEAAGHSLAARAIVADEVEHIRAQVKAWLADPGLDVIITTGGTGFTGRDVTPEAVEPLFEKRMDGFSTVFHLVSHQKIGSSTIQSPTPPISSACPARPEPAAMPGTRSSCISSITATGRATSSN